MPRPTQPRGSIARWIGLLLLIIALPLFVRANSTVQVPPASIPETNEPSVEQDLVPPEEGPTSTPTPTAAPTATPTAEPEAAEGGIVFIIGGADPSQETLEPDQPASTPTAPQATAIVTAEPTQTVQPTNPPGVWTYSNDSIDVTITQHQQDDFVYFAADILLQDASQLSYAFSNERFGAHTEALSDIAERHNPVLAINGDYYSFHNNGIIIRGGELFRKANSARALLIVEENGDLTVMTDRTEKQGVVANRLLERNVRHTFEFGPVLVREGEAVKLNSAILRVGEGYLEPRTAIGQLGPLHYLVIVVDGRSKGYSEGCDLPTLQQLFMDFGVETAFNLDGGGSTTLWFDGEVINHPSAGDERKVSDIVMFMGQPQ